MIASFQVQERGLEHQAPMPQAPDPESLPSMAELRHKWIAEAGEVQPRIRASLERSLAIDFRPVQP